MRSDIRPPPVFALLALVLTSFFVWALGWVEPFGSGRQRFWTLPTEPWIWVPAGAIVLWNVYAWWRWHVFKRTPEHPYCSKCGYNLFGNVSGRCPECGQPVSQEKEKEERASPPT